MPVIRRRPDTADDSFTIHRRTSLGSNTTDTSAGNGSLSSTDDEAISNGTTDIRSTGNASTSDDGGSEVEWSNVLVGSEDSRSLISNDSGRSSFVDVPDGSVVDAESEDEDPYGNSGMGEGNLPFMIEGGWLDGMPDLTGAWNRDERMGDGCTPTATHGPFIRERLTPAQAAWTQEVFLVRSDNFLLNTDDLCGGG